MFFDVLVLDESHVFQDGEVAENRFFFIRIHHAGAGWDEFAGDDILFQNQQQTATIELWS